MMNLSSLFKTKQTLLFLVALLTVLVYSLINGDFILSGVIGAVIIASVFIPSDSTTGSSKNSKLQDSVVKVLKDAAEGKLEGRITHIPDNGSAESAFAWTVNDVLDQLEAFMRDAQTSIEYASKGKTYRRTQPIGLHGIFRVTSEKLNEAIGTISSGYKTRIKGSYHPNLAD